MARGDYRGCDVCDGKAFYDANLSYEEASDEWVKSRRALPYRVAGESQYPGNPELNDKYGSVLGYVGDWAVVCDDCAKAWRTRVERIAVDGEAEYLSWATAAGGQVAEKPEGGGAQGGSDGR